MVALNTVVLYFYSGYSLSCSVYGYLHVSYRHCHRLVCLLPIPKKAGGTTKKTTKKKAAGDKGTKRKKPTPKTPTAGTPATEGAAASTSTAAVKGDGDDSNPKKRAKVS